MIGFEQLAGLVPWWPAAYSLGFSAVIYTLARDKCYHEPEVTQSVSLRLLCTSGNPIRRYVSFLEALMRLATSLLFRDNGDSAEKSVVSLRNFPTFLAFSLTYTIMLLFLSWLVGGTGLIESEPILPTEYAAWQRALIFSSIFLIAAFGGFSLINHAKISSYIFSVTGFPPTFLLNFATAFISASLVTSAFWFAADQVSEFLPLNFINLEARPTLSMLIFICVFSAVYYVEWCIMSFFCCLGSSFFLIFNIPILIGVPLALGIVMLDLRERPTFWTLVYVGVFLIVFSFFSYLEFVIDLSIVALMATIPIILLVYFAHIRRYSQTFTIFLVFCSWLPIYIVVVSDTAQGSPYLPSTILIFWLILPLINALWDFLSFLVTFWLLKELVVRLKVVTSPSSNDLRQSDSFFFSTLFMCIIYIVADILIGFFFVCATFLSIFLTLKFSNWLSIFWVFTFYIDIDSLFQSFLTKPFEGNGFFVTSLIFTAIIPTMAHMSFVVVSFFIFAFMPAKVHDSIVILSASGNCQNDFLRQQACYRLTFYFSAVTFVGTMSIFAIFYTISSAIEKGGAMRVFVAIYSFLL